MKNFSLFLSLIFLSALISSQKTVWGATRAHFLVMQAMIQIQPRDTAGAVDPDSVILYNAMLAPEQDSMVGRGKNIATADRKFNFTCAQRETMNYECSILLQNSPQLVMDRASQIIKFETHGALAEELTRQFRWTEEQFHFISTDRLFRIDAKKDHFVLMYSAQGVL